MIGQDDIQQLFGTDVHESDGSKIGSTAQVYLDDQTGNPEWVSVKTGLFGLKESFVPLEGATLSGERIQVPFTKDQVKNAPRIDPDGSLTPAEEDELYAYYGLTSADGRLSTGGYDDAETGADYATASGPTASGPTADDAMTRTEEAGKARLRRYVVTGQQQAEVPVSREEPRLDREPVTDTNRGPAF